MNKHQYSARSQSRRKRPLSPYIRETILNRDGRTCGYCGYEATCVDHIVPFSYGGTDDHDNLLAACGICNSILHNKVFETLEMRREYLRGRYGPYLQERIRRYRKKISICAGCGYVFPPRVAGASAVLCADCYAADERGDNGSLREDRPCYRFELSKDPESLPDALSDPRGDDVLGIDWAVVGHHQVALWKPEEAS